MPSEMCAKDAPDYDQLFELFEGLAAKHLDLGQKVLQSPDPHPKSLPKRTSSKKASGARVVSSSSTKRTSDESRSRSKNSGGAQNRSPEKTRRKTEVERLLEAASNW